MEMLASGACQIPKSEIPSTKSETKKKTENHENPKLGKAEKENLSSIFHSFAFSCFSSLFCFGFRISCFKIGMSPRITARFSAGRYFA